MLTSLSGRGTFPDDDPLAAGGLGAHRNRLSKRLLEEADVVIGLGTRFEEMETNWQPGRVPAPDAAYVQVDIEAAEIGRSVPAALGVVGDVRAVLRQAIELVRELGASPRPVTIEREVASLEADIAALAAESSSPVHPLTAIRAVQEVFPRESTVGFDVGCLAQQIAGGFPFFRVYEPRSLIVPSSFYGMGFVAAAMPVAKIVRPDHPAVCFAGDGSFQMVMQILPVAAEHDLPVTWVVLDDNALGSIRDIQELRFEGRMLGTDFTVQPDFAAIAEACGCHGERVERSEDLVGALERALQANRDARGLRRRARPTARAGVPDRLRGRPPDGSPHRLRRHPAKPPRDARAGRAHARPARLLWAHPRRVLELGPRHGPAAGGMTFTSAPISRRMRSAPMVNGPS